MRDTDGYGEESDDILGPELGYALDCLRILHAPICSHCWNDGEIVPGTEECCDPWGRVYDHLCASCYDRESEGAWESHCADFYGGSGPSDRDQFDAARDSGRRT